jgi:CPA1 family monovalent cation:H+ antiporter
MIDFLLESIVFALIGLQLTVILDSLSERSSASLIGYAAAILATVIVGRFIWVYPATYLPRLLSPSLRQRDPYPPWQTPFVISWAGMRGVVSLAAAFAIPFETDAGTPFPARDMILFLTFVVILGTLVLQGLTLPAVIRRLGVKAEPQVDALAEAAAQHEAARAALARLEELIAAQPHSPPEDIVKRLRDGTERRSLGAWERLGGDSASHGGETPSAAYRRLRRAMLQAEREAILEMRDAGRIDDEVLRRMQHELDLEEALLSRD